MVSDGMSEPLGCPPPGLLARIIAETVPLTPFDHEGDRQRGACPFHPDRSVSLFVHDAHWHCFACQAGGDAIRWIMRRDAVAEVEACARLTRYRDKFQFN